METRAVVLRTLMLIVLAVSASGCQAIGTIFEAGAWTGAIMVVLILAAVAFVIAKLRG